MFTVTNRRPVRVNRSEVKKGDYFLYNDKLYLALGQTASKFRALCLGTEDEAEFRLTHWNKNRRDRRVTPVTVTWFDNVEFELQYC